MQKLNKRYKILDFLGKGNYGITYKALDTKDNSIIALKIVDINLLTRKKNYQLIEQFKLLSYINHPFIIKPISLEKVYFIDDDIFEQEAFFYTMPFISNSYPIDKFILENYNNEKLIIEVLFKIISSINFLHHFNISHNDIQKHNILIDLKKKDPVLLDLFPLNLDKELFYIDYKNLKTIVSSVNVKMPKVFNFFYNFEKSNYDFNFLYKKYSKILSEKPEIYFYNRNIIPDSSTFNFKKFFDKIIKDDNNFFLLSYPDSFFLNIFANNFYTYLKPQSINTILFTKVQDLYNFLYLISGKEVNDENIEIILSDYLVKHNLNIVTQDFYSIYPEDRKFIYFLINKYLNKYKNIKLFIFSSKLELSLNNKTVQKIRINIQQKDGFDSLYKLFNLIKIKNLPNEFIEEDPFHIYSFYKAYSKSISFFNNKKSKNISKIIFENLLEIYEEKFEISRLSLSQKLILYLFSISDTPLFLDEIFKIKYKSLNHFEISQLLKKNLIIQNELRFFELFNNFLKFLFNKIIFSKNLKFFSNFGIYFLENNKNTPIKEKVYIELLYKVKDKDKLLKELIIFIKNYPIYSWFDEFFNIYDYIFSIDINYFSLEDIYYIVYNYYVFYRIYLNSKGLLKLYNWLSNYKNIQKENLLIYYKIFIKLLIAFIDFNKTEFENEIKNLDIDFLIKNNLLFFINELFYFSVHLYIEKNISFFYNLIFKDGKIIYLNNIEICLLFFTLGHLIQKKDLPNEEKDKVFLIISDIVCNDSIEMKLFPLAGKAKHNIAYITERTEKNIDKALKFYEEAITIYKKFKMYSQLALTYNNLAIIHEIKIYDSKRSLFYYEESLHYARLSSANQDTLTFILINLLLKYFDNFEFSKYKKILKELFDIFNKNPNIPYKLRFLSLYISHLNIFGNYAESSKFIKQIDSNITEYENSNYFYNYINSKMEYYFFRKEINKLNKLFFNFFEKNDFEFKLEITNSYLYFSLLSIIIYKTKINFKNELIKFIESLDSSESELTKKTKNLYEIIKIINNNLYSNEVKEFFINELKEYDNIYFSIEYLLSLGILGIFFNEDDFLYKFFNYLRIVYNKLPKLYKTTILKIEPIKQLLNFININISEIINKNKLVQKIQFISKTKYDINNLLITKIFEPFIREDNIDIIEKIKIILKYLFKWGKITYAAIYSVDNYYKIKKIFEFQSKIFKKTNPEFSFSFFNQLISTGEPITYLELPDDFKNPIFLSLIPILTENISQKRKSTSYYYLDTFRYYVHIESRYYINPFWNINKEVFFFISNLISFASRYNDILFENLYDPLTNVYLRNSFIKRVKISLSNYKKGSLFFIDIDNFKQINDIFGHNYGDKVLIEIAKIVKNSLRGNDIVGRYGGEEFIVFIPNLDYDNSRFIAERIRLNVNNAKIIQDRKVSVTIGISIYPDDSNILDLLIQKAEIANRVGKRMGKNLYLKYNPSIETDLVETDKTYGLISRDPIKTQENIKILLKIIDIHNNFLQNLCTQTQNFFNINNLINEEELTKNIFKIFEQIKKVIFFDIFILVKDDKKVTNLKNNKFIEDVIIASKELYGFTRIYKRPYNYLKMEIDNIKVYIGNFKGFTYNDEYFYLLNNCLKSVGHLLNLI